MRRADSHPAMAPLRLGISACLLGQAVRYDGGHKRDPFLAETLGRFVEWVPVCPEAELARLDLVGYVFKKDSPSCGMERVRVHGGGRPRRRGTGLFARALMERLP